MVISKKEKTDKLALILWNYMKMNHKLEKSDLIMVMGSNDIRVAKWGAKLLLDGYAPLLLYSGGLGKITKNIFSKPEAILFSKIAVRLGVPKKKILIEDKSTNTGENVHFSKELLESKGIYPKRIILVQSPYMERRAYATFKKVWSEPELILTSPLIPYEEYPNKIMTKRKMINVIVGDFQRVIEYPKKGFQIKQKISREAMLAYQQLVDLGYNQALVK